MADPGADLGGADLRVALLGGVTADQCTIWPDGFDWQGAGVRLRRSNTCP